MERGLRVNLACGEKHWPGFENVKEANLLELPYDDQSVDEIHLIHVFEHLPRGEIYVYLEEWKRALKVGGLLVIEVPCLNKIAEMVLAGETNPQKTLAGIYGNVFKDDPYMWHRWCYTEWELKEVLKDWEVEIMPPVFHYPERDIRAECRRIK